MRYHETVIMTVGIAGTVRPMNRLSAARRPATRRLPSGPRTCATLWPSTTMSCFLPAEVPDVVAQQRFGLEAEAFEDGDGADLVDGHLHHQLFEPGARAPAQTSPATAPGRRRARARRSTPPCGFRRHAATTTADRGPGCRSPPPGPPCTASRLVMAPRSISLIQAASTFGSLMLRGRNNRSCTGSFCAKSSTAASSACAISRNSISPASVVTRRG